MKVIALVPVRNDGWVLEHSLACWSGFCDVVLVSDQGSTDGSRDICRRFPKVVVIDSTADETLGRLPQQARWRLLDAARGYDGQNLLWCTDADELTPPTFARQLIERQGDQLVPGRVIECRFYNVWRGMTRYREDLGPYGPRWKPMGFVDDRQVDYPRSPGLRPLHEPRMPVETDGGALRAEELPVLHLQWAIWRRNQMKQAWYRCIDLLDRRMSAAGVNEFYAVTLPELYVHTEPLPPAWTTDITLPDPRVDAQPSWHEAEIRAWFDKYGIEVFEGLEIWHISALRREFRRRTGRSPRPDRSYRPPWAERARRLSRRAFHAVKRRVLP